VICFLITSLDVLTHSLNTNICVGYFPLTRDVGDVHLIPYLFGLCLLVWGIGAAKFIMHMCGNSGHAYTTPLTKLVSAVAVSKLLVLVFSITFWLTCLAWRMCSFWIAILWINVNLLYEITYFFCFLIVSKGIYSY
jgi:hypothetical protein